MRWDERRVAMLREMGIRLWWPERHDGPGSSGAPAPAHPGPGVTAESAASPRPVVNLPAPAPAGAPAFPPDGVGRSPAGAAVESAPLALSAVATLDWPALRSAAADCTACPLCAGRTRSVFGGTSARADWLIVGEPPVEAEDREGEPFVGPPGQLLDNMLRAVGVRRGDELAVPAQRACVTVPVKCRPPANRPPTAAEFATCESYLARQIELVEPRIVVAMGRAAPLLLRTDEPLGKLRGRVHRYRGLPLIATYAPAYLIRHPADKARAWEDLCLAVEALGVPAPAF